MAERRQWPTSDEWPLATPPNETLDAIRAEATVRVHRRRRVAATAMAVVAFGAFALRAADDSTPSATVRVADDRGGVLEPEPEVVASDDAEPADAPDRAPAARPRPRSGQTTPTTAAGSSAGTDAVAPPPSLPPPAPEAPPAAVPAASAAGRLLDPTGDPTALSAGGADADVRAAGDLTGTAVRRAGDVLRLDITVDDATGLRGRDGTDITWRWLLAAQGCDLDVSGRSVVTGSSFRTAAPAAQVRCVNGGRTGRATVLTTAGWPYGRSNGYLEMDLDALNDAFAQAAAVAGTRFTPIDRGSYLRVVLVSVTATDGGGDRRGWYDVLDTANRWVAVGT